MKKQFLLSAVTASLLLPFSVEAQNLTPDQITAYQKVIKDYLITNPEVIEETIIALQEKKNREKMNASAKSISEKSDQLLKNPTDPILGNPNGAKTLVVFHDPFCGHCRNFHKVLQQAMDDNQDLKVISKDFPILGEVSILAVRAMQAAHKQGFYTQMQEMMYKAAPTLNKQEVLTLAKTISGLDISRFEADMASADIGKIIQTNHDLAESIGITATPSFVLNGTLYEGAMSFDNLKKTINKA